MNQARSFKFSFRDSYGGNSGELLGKPEFTKIMDRSLVWIDCSRKVVGRDVYYDPDEIEFLIRIPGTIEPYGHPLFTTDIPHIVWATKKSSTFTPVTGMHPVLCHDIFQNAYYFIGYANPKTGDIAVLTDNVPVDIDSESAMSEIIWGTGALIETHTFKRRELMFGVFELILNHLTSLEGSIEIFSEIALKLVKLAKLEARTAPNDEAIQKANISTSEYYNQIKEQLAIAQQARIDAVAALHAASVVDASGCRRVNQSLSPHQIMHEKDRMLRALRTVKEAKLLASAAVGNAEMLADLTSESVEE